jgi:hypothetical protein
MVVSTDVGMVISSTGRVAGIPMEASRQALSISSIWHMAQTRLSSHTSASTLHRQPRAFGSNPPPPPDNALTPSAAPTDKYSRKV